MLSNVCHQSGLETLCKTELSALVASLLYVCRESLAFATEPAFCSLANILGETENMPVPPPPELKDYQLFDVEIKYGFLQVRCTQAALVHKLCCITNLFN